MSEQTAAKVTGAHLARTAYLYVRQSTLRQVLTNTESAARQYALRQKAIALGWDAEQIVTIDTDQGQSGASAADREGFQRLVAEVGMGRAGIVLGLEVSRLARNNADWHRLLEICAMSGTLICDEDGLYDPTDFNDRLLLGLKGTMSEAELHFIRARLIGGQLSKARRGELQHGACRSGWSTTPPARSCSTPIPVCNKPSGTCSPCSPAPARRAQPCSSSTPTGCCSRCGCAPGPQGRAGLDAAAALAGAAHPAQSPLRRRVRLRPPPRTPRHQRQEDLPDPAPRAVDRADPRRPPRLHQLGPVRDQPEAAAGQRHRARRRPRRRPRPRRHRPAAGPGHLRALRAAHDGALPHPPRHRGPRLPMHEPLHPRRRATLPNHPRRRRRRRRRHPAARHPHPARARGRPHRAGRTRHPRRRSRRAAPPSTSNAPATAPTWPAAATWPSTPTTGSSPTASKPTGTTRCAPCRPPARTTSAPAPPPQPPSPTS